MIVYKFLNSTIALKVLRERRLKISGIKDLNDPFELIPFDLTNPPLREAILKTRDAMHEKYGLICFSRKWSNPVLWAHYSDNHRGICLGFDAVDGYVKPVDYLLNRFQFPSPTTQPTTQQTDQMLYTKYDAWSYEQEARIWATKTEAYDDGLYYSEIDNERISLRQVILGARCEADITTINDAVNTYPAPVRITRAQLSWTSFEVVEDEGATAVERAASR